MSVMQADDPLSASGVPVIPPEQPDSGGEHPIVVAQGGVDPQQPLTSKQELLKNKFGLSERICASFKEESEWVQTFVQDLGKGKFSPGPIKKFILWLSSKFGGPDYEVAVQQFRVQTAAAKSQEIFKQEDFQRDLAAAIRSCNGEELLQALQGAHDLLADPEARRDFFVNKLLTPCLEAVPEEMSKIQTETDGKAVIESYEKFLKINQFCVNNRIMLTEVEKKRADTSFSSIQNKNTISFAVTEAMYYIITGTEDEKKLCSQFLQDLQSFKPKIREDLKPCFTSFDAMNGDFPEILQPLGENRDEQVGNFRVLVNALRSVVAGISARHEPQTDDWSDGFKQEGSKFFRENSKFLFEMLGLSKKSASFCQIIFPRFFRFRGGPEDIPGVLKSAARETMRNAMDSTAETNESFSDEQVQLLCDGANLAALLEYQQDIEKNRDTIDMVLQFVQAKALGNPPKISFEDIMPQTISSETCQRLQRFVEGGNYGQSLKDFIKNGIEQRTAPRPA